VPESFKVLIKEMRSLGLDVELIGSSEEEELGDMVEAPTTTSFMDAITEDDEINIENALEEITSNLLSLDFDLDISDSIPSLVDLDDNGLVGNNSVLSVTNSPYEPSNDEPDADEAIFALIDESEEDL
ncbi:MAG: hypothetical protein FWH40_09465, partial [Coriobacteriia bacterium]|nr:hypothetical protein [Coriobacteriia bacterium]